jgi:GNAT superfamily N-acetyltransferase
VVRLEPDDNNSVTKHPVDKDADADPATRSTNSTNSDSETRNRDDNGHDGDSPPPLGYSAPKSSLGNRVGIKQVYKLGRLAVLREFRKYRLGRALVLAVHEWVKQDAEKRGNPEAEIVSNSQIPAKGFYAK